MFITRSTSRFLTMISVGSLFRLFNDSNTAWPLDTVRQREKLALFACSAMGAFS